MSDPTGSAGGGHLAEVLEPPTPPYAALTPARQISRPAHMTGGGFPSMLSGRAGFQPHTEHEC